MCFSGFFWFVFFFVPGYFVPILVCHLLSNLQCKTKPHVEATASPSAMGRLHWALSSAKHSRFQAYFMVLRADY